MTTLNGIGNRVSARTEYGVNGAQYINHNGFGPRDYDKWRMDWNGNHGIAPPDVGTVLWLPGQPGAGSTVIDYSSTVLDVGSAATDRDLTLGPLSTLIDLSNTADFTGYITSIQVWAASDLTGLRVGTFYLVSGNTYTCRDSATIGSVTAGSAQTFSGLNIRVVTGDYIGCYRGAGAIEYSNSGGGGIKRLSSTESIDPGDSADFGATFDADGAISLYATGAGSFGNNGALTGTTWGRLPSGLPYLNFDGSDDRTAITLNLETLYADWSIECWIDFTNLALNAGILGYNGNFTLYRSAGGIQLYWSNGVVLTFGNVVLANGWHHIVAQRNGAAWTGYTNGVLDDSVSDADTGGAATLYLGGQGAGNYGQTKIALFRIYNTILAAGTVASHYNQERHLLGV